jgi:hypothetical protein
LALPFQTGQGEFRGQRAGQPIFLALHFPTGDGVEIIVAEQMQNAVDKITDQLGGPGGMKFKGLAAGDIEADEYFSMDRIFRRAPGGFGIIECDDVGGTGMLEIRFVKAGHFRSVQEVEAKFPAGGGAGLEQVQGYFPEEAQVDKRAAEMAAQDDAHFGWPRCSS